MRIMKCKWINRGIAGLLMVSMLVSTAPVAYAQEIQTNKEIATLTENVPDTELDNSNDASTDAAGTVTGDSAASEVDTAPTAGTSDNNVTGNSAASEVDTASTSGTSDNAVTGNSAASEADTASTAGTSDNTVTGDNVTSEVNSAADTDVDADTVAGDVADTEMDGAANTDADADIDVVAAGVSETDGTITVSDAAGLIELSNTEASTYYNKTIKIAMTGSQTIYDLTQSVTINEMQMSFEGLGSTDAPFQGTILFPEGSNKPIKTKVPLFNSVSNTANLPDLTFQIDDVNAIESAGEFTTQPLLAKIVTVTGTGNATWNISLAKGESKTEKLYTIGGVIGTLQSGTVSLNVTNNVPNTLRVTGDGNRGLFCNTMESGANLTAKLTKGAEAGQISVYTASGDAGGFVGCMKGNNTLTVSGSGVSNVTSSSGDAGGLVGSCTANTGTLDLSNITLDTTLSGEQNAGGVFGKLNNTSGTYKIQGGTVKSVLTSGTNYGGLIGTYSAENLKNILEISGITNVSSSGGNNASAYGGVICIVSGSSYVAINNIVASTSDMPGNDKYFGGLVAKMTAAPMLNVGNVTLTTSNDNDSSTVDVLGGRGGLVGYIEKGVLRLYGITDLSNQKITKSYAYTGQIVGKNDNGLVYALGNGNNAANDGNSGWTFKRYSGSDHGNSDIGNWGEVVRQSDTYLIEGEDGLFTFDSTNHTVTLNVPVKNNTTGKTEITSVKDFVAYALAFDISGAYSGDNSVLNFSRTVSSTEEQNVTLASDINLSGTGILGIGKDNNSQSFKGTFDGNTHSVTLDIGGTYGRAGENAASEEENGSGQIYVQRNGNNILAHVNIALFPKTEDVTINNVTLNGNVKCALSSGSQNRDNSVFVAAAVAYASGNMTFSEVKVSTKIAADSSDKEIYIMQGGFVGEGKSNNGKSLSFSSCKWDIDSTISNERDQDRNRVGGFAGKITDDSTVIVSDCILSGMLDVKKGWVGGLGAEIAAGVNITITNLTVDGERVNVTGSSAGLLGYRWYKTNVTFNGSDSAMGVTVKNSSLDTGNNPFGGLVYWATGYWNATASNSIIFSTVEDDVNKVNKFNGTYKKNNPSGLLVGNGLFKEGTAVSALYLEVGTWGESGSAYYIMPESVSLTSNNSTLTVPFYFDEVVGKTIADNKGNENAVVSLATPNHDKIDTNICDTYKRQLSDEYQYMNGNARYYYNLDSFRQSKAGYTQVDSAETLVLWSVSQYAAENIRNKFRTKPTDSVTIKNDNDKDIDLTGYSYYPVTPLSSVTVGDAGTNSTITFGFEEMNPKEIINKQFTDSDYQHYLMQCGLLYNAKNVTVQNTTLSGSVGKTSTETNGKFDSGALIYGSVSGDVNNNTIYTVKLANVTLAGLRVTGVDTSTDYAPLLINKISKFATLTVDGLSTDERYVDGGETKYAASSLIGDVGIYNDTTANNLTLSFSNIALDSRIEGKGTGTSVMNNGQNKVEYYTTHTIFTRATLLNSFWYTSDCTGTYNFNSNDNKVTYGVEISNTDSGRNQGRQYHYFDEITTISWDGVGTCPTDSGTDNHIKDYYSAEKYLRYVKEKESEDSGYKELDINIRVANLLEGCGTYGDPYKITDGAQLIQLASYINGADTGNSKGWVVCVNDSVYSSKQTQDNYHLSTTEEKGDNLYYCDGSGWYTAAGAVGNYQKGDPSEKNMSGMRDYLRNAYYQIQNDIEISSNTYRGIGDSTTDKAFSGVIVGKSTNGTQPTVFISVAGTVTGGFGGLIRCSQGSVVKDLTISYEGGLIVESGKVKTIERSYITMNNTASAKTSNNPFFGGVVGYCIGGDTIIDKVSVKYSAESVKLTDTTDKGYDRVIAAGGYLGLVGGAKNTVGNEITGGGVVFRNMDTAANTFANTLSYAKQETPDVNPNGTSKESCTYFYCNTYIGRVLDGYACYETQVRDSSGHTLNNTDKNYTIPDIVPGRDDLIVNDNEVTVNTNQGLWLLSAIVNSGAAAMNNSGKYEDVNEIVNAYQLGKPRSASYDGIGEDGVEEVTKNAVLEEESRWGGVNAETDIDRISYLVKKYAKGAEHLTSGKTIADSLAVNLTFANNMDMTTYGNGFRGIGGSFGECKSTWNNSGDKSSIKGRFLRVKSINTVNNNQGEESDTSVIITLGMNRHDYSDNYNNNTWYVQGAGLFIGFTYQENCTVNNLTLSGKSKLTLYTLSDSTEYYKKTDSYGEAAVGGFAARTINAKGELRFNNFELRGLTVYGGHHAAGAIGLLERIGGDKTLVFSNWYIGKDKNEKEVCVSKKTDNDGSSAGLLGWCYGGSVTINGVGKNSEKWNVDSLKIESEAKSNGSVASGGLIGAVDGTTITIKGVRAKDMSVSGKKTKDVGGLVAGLKVNNASLTVEDCLLQNVELTGTSTYVGGVIGRLEKEGTITNVTIAGTSDKPIKISSSESVVGGFIGWVDNTVTIKDCNVEYVHILSKADAGGMIGMMGKNSNTTKASNISFVNVIVATKSNNNYTGLLMGNNNNKILYGYNILAKNCKTGYVTDTSATVGNLKNVTDNNWNITKSGLWVGNASGTVKLVAVGVDGTNVPQKDCGSGSASITYADYPAVQTDTTGSSDPWLDVNPVSELTVNNETKLLTLTGNGVGYIMNTTNENGTEMLTTTQGDSVANTILNEAKVNASTRKYLNVRDTSAEDKTFSILLEKENSNGIYVDTYLQADSTTTYGGTDFPIVVVKTNANKVVSEQLWNFIAAMTNTDNGDKAKANVSGVTATTYRWTDKGEAGSFDKQEKSSLTIDSSKNILTNGRFDNEQSQFTLLDVQYNDPTGSNPKGFHLYIPVLVVKTLTVKVNVDILEGTNYYSGDYIQLRNNKHYATAGFGEPITAFIEYNYERSADEWQRSLDNGEDLLWYYHKTIGLLNANESGGKQLPTGTKMLLLDKQNSNLYEYTMTDSVDQNCFDFENFTLVGSKIEQHFTPTPICDLLNISAEKKTDNTGTYVMCNEESATVRDKDGKYYRPKNDDETGAITYNLTVGADVMATDNKYLKQGDAYYLTMEVPKTEGVTVINNLMGAAAGSLERSDMAPPNNVLPEDKVNGTRMYNDRYFFYYFLNQGELSVESKHLSNGKEQSTTEMKQGDSIQITLSTPLSLTSEGRENYAYKPRSMYQQFSIDLKKYDDANRINGAAAPIGADSASWTYQVLDGDTSLFTASGAQFGLQNLSSLTIGYGGTENGTGSENLYLPKLLYAKASGIADAQLANNPLTVKLVVTLEYPNVNGFPVRANTNLESTDGLSVHGVSRVANQESQLPITTIKNDKDEENKRYYTSELSYVTLNYNAVQKGIGESIHRDDTNTQLGINPSDELGNILPVFTLGYYDYSQVAVADMTSAKKIRYTVELFQKDDDGNYTNAYLVPISGANGCWEDGYLVQVDNKDVALEKDTNTNRYICTPDIPADENGNQYSGSSIRIDFTPVMGAEFERRNLTYANYKIRLTAVLLDAEGKEITGTKASDYIIYTNARIYQGMIETPTSITSGQ